MVLLPVILALAALAALLGLVGSLSILLRGAMGWASQGPQQHTLLTLKPEPGSVAVALNGVANDLGGAVGAALGGRGQVLAGIAALPVTAAGVAVSAPALQLAILPRRRPMSALGAPRPR